MVDALKSLGGDVEREQEIAKPLLGALVVLFVLLGLGNVPGKPLAFAAVLLFAAPLIWLHRARLPDHAAASWPLLCIGAFLAVSPVWSVLPKVSVPLVTTQVLMIAVAWLLASSLKLATLLGAMRTALLILVCVSLLASVAQPGLWLDPTGWRGVLSHKNQMGQVLALALILCVMREGPHSRVWWLLIALFGVLLLLTRSKTAIAAVGVAMVVALCAQQGLRRLQARRTGVLMLSDVVRWILFLTFCAGLLALVIWRREVLAWILVSISPDALTGRGKLWIIVLQRLDDASLLGLGAGVFWQAGDASEISQTLAFYKDPVWLQRMISSDGSYVDIVASYGAVGLALFLLLVVKVVGGVARRFEPRESILLLAIVSFVLIHAVNESTLFQSPNLLWFAFLLVACACLSGGVRERLVTTP